MQPPTRATLRTWLRTWGPPLALMALLFVASAQPGSDPPDDLTWIYFSGIMPMFTGLLELLVKKSGHFLVYGLLGLLWMRALAAGGRDARRAGYLAIAVATGYAITDEFHQAFVPGRHASGIDIGVDFAGAAVFALLALRYYFRQKTEAARAREPL